MIARSIVTLGLLGVAGLSMPVIHPVAPRLIWNASASVPIGLYRLRPCPQPKRGMMVAVRPPARVARLASERGYLPMGVPLLKWVAGIEGDIVCRAGDTVFVDGRALGHARPRDRKGRPLPQWHGCAWLGPGDVFVMNPAVRDSFDGRYFGVLATSDIIGRATPVWPSRAATRAPSSPTKETVDDPDR